MFDINIFRPNFTGCLAVLMLLLKWEVLYLPWGKKKPNQRKIEIKFNNLFGKKKKTKIFQL